MQIVENVQKKIQPEEISCFIPSSREVKVTKGSTTTATAMARNTAARKNVTEKVWRIK